MKKATEKREHIDLSAFWQAVDEHRLTDSERERQRIATALNRVAAESSAISFDGLLVYGVREVAVMDTLDFVFRGEGGKVVAATMMPWIWCKALVVTWLDESLAEIREEREAWPDKKESCQAEKAWQRNEDEKSCFDCSRNALN